MQALSIEATDKTPSIHFDPANGHFEIKGKSIPNDAEAFYAPVLEWMEAYIKSPGARTNFELNLEWKVDTGANSGIIFYVNEDSAKYEWPWNTGMEMQVLDNDRHPDAKIPKHRAGDLYDLISCSRETVKPALEWNKAGIRALNGKLDLFLNGENVVSTTLWDDNWKKLIAGSKFKAMPNFGTFKKGRIALQDHGNKVWYRNIMIKKL